MLTRLLLAINIVAFGWEYFSGALTSDSSLLTDGALLGTLVRDGQWWRIFTSGFLHGGALHILFNMFALWQVGYLSELVFGPGRMAFIYFFSMFTSGLLVTYLEPTSVTIGASGAIFGLFGALAAAGLRLGPPGRELMRQTIGVIVLNLILTYSLPGISKSGHVGGLAGGFVTGFLLFRRRPRAQPQPVYQASPPVDLSHDPNAVTIEQDDEDPR